MKLDLNHDRNDNPYGSYEEQCEADAMADQESEELRIEFDSRYDDVQERYASTEIDNLSEAMGDEGWEGTRAEYVLELARRDALPCQPLFVENERLEGDSFGSDDIEF